jgi:predicted RNase H-like HicB family nuclease
VAVHEILMRPYRRVLIPEPESGTYTASIAEFPGCISEGDSPAEAYENLEEAAVSWLEAVIEGGLPIPEPEAENEYSGRVVLRMPKSTHRRAVDAAKTDGVSLNTFLLSAISEHLGRQSSSGAQRLPELTRSDG